jgi:hypothetical protein
MNGKLSKEAELELLVERVLKTFERRPVDLADLSAEAVANAIQRAANKALSPESALYKDVMREVEKIRRKG